jgi:hypothetical protein
MSLFSNLVFVQTGRLTDKLKLVIHVHKVWGIRLSDGIGLFLNYCANYTGATGPMQSGISYLQGVTDGREC